MLTTKNLTPFSESIEFYLGLILAIISSIFIGSSFVIKKKALILINRSGCLRAGSGGYGYLKDKLWWTGFLTMSIGEAINFTAYAFAPASLITPLGGLSVLISSVLSAKYLNEKLNVIGKLGCFLCILGSTIIVIHSPKAEGVETLDGLIDKLQDPIFISYVLLVLLASFLIGFYYGPNYGKQNVLVYIILCSAVGSITVMSCKGFGFALKETVFGLRNNLNNEFTYIFLVTASLCVLIQMNYLNKALDLFNTSIVTPIYYVVFTTLVITASTILFKEWQTLTGEDILGGICGFLVIIVAIILLHGFKDININVGDMQGILKPKLDPKPNFDKIHFGSNDPFIRTV